MYKADLKLVFNLNLFHKQLQTCCYNFMHYGTYIFKAILKYTKAEWLN